MAAFEDAPLLDKEGRGVVDRLDFSRTPFFSAQRQAFLQLNIR
jgi:hypothetical protein